MLTILTSANARPATKRHTPAGTVPYGREKHWLWREVPTPDFAALAAELVRLESAPYSMVVLGSVAPAWRDKHVIPRTKSQGDPSLEDVGTHVLHLDIDEAAIPPGTSWSDPAGVAAAVWRDIGERLPALAGVTVHWQASASAGMPGKENLAKLHFWVLADQPLKEQQRRELLKLAGADPAMASVNQPHYTAAPFFDGVPDPLADKPRSGDLQGARERVPVGDVPWPVKAPARPRQAARTAVRLDRGSLTHGTNPAGLELLERACARISTLPPGGRNSALNRIAFGIAGHVAGGSIAHDQALDRLLQAGAASGHARYREAIANGFEAGLLRPITAPPAPGEPPVPYIAAPTADRESSIAAHAATIRNWAAVNVPALKGVRAVALAYVSEMPNAAEKMRIRRRVRDQFGLDFLPASRVTESTPVSRVLLSGAAGVGKTAACVGRDGETGILHETFGLVSAMLEPDHGMAQQAAADYELNAPLEAPPSIVVRGRNAPDPTAPGATMCRLGGVAGRLAGAGVSVRQVLCEKCPFRADCSYLRQEAQLLEMVADPAGVVIFATHDFAWLPLPGQADPDLVIFDERPRDYGIETAGVTPAEMAAPLKFIAPMSSPRAANDRQADALANHLQHIQPLKIALRDAARDRPNDMLAALRERGINRDWIAAAIAGLDDFKDDSASRAMADAMLSHRRARRDPAELQAELEAVLDAKDLKNIRALGAVFAAVLREIDMPRHASVGFFVEAGGDLVATATKSLRIGRGAFLHLDATADAEMGKRLFGPLDVEHHPVERSPAERGDRVEQVVGRQFHTRGLTGDYQAAWAADYAEQNESIIAALKPGSLFVAPKQALAALSDRIPVGVEVAHFGALRGRNDWSGFDNVLLTRAEQPGAADVERIARAFAATDPGPFKSLGKGRYPTEQRGIRTRSGPAHPVEVAAHPDPWGDRVLRQIRDAEMIQAIDRLRLIFRTRPVNIVVLASVALDLTVDVTRSFAEFAAGGSRVERALRDAKVVPLEKREAARLLPGIWGSPDAAKRDLGLLGQTVNRDLYLRFGPIRNLVKVAYAAPPAPGGRKRVHEALVAAPPTEARALLEAMTGPLEDFEVVEVLVDRPAPAPAVENPAPAKPQKAPRPPYVFRGKVEEKVEPFAIIPFRAKG